MEYWKKETKLNKSETIKIILDILVGTLNITTAIINGNIAWVMCGMLWLLIALIEYCSYKISKEKDALINIQDKCIRTQEGIINALLKETAIEVDINKIKIPKHFSKPNQKKLQEKFKYYKKHNKFESPIIIDTDYNLIDGYTSYLIAKNYNKTSVIVKLKRKENQNNENEDN